MMSLVNSIRCMKARLLKASAYPGHLLHAVTQSQSHKDLIAKCGKLLLNYGSILRQNP